MWKVILLLISIGVAKGCRVIEQKANGEAITSRDEYSYVVLLEMYDKTYENKYYCSGVLLSNKYVLTARKCTFGASFVNVHVNVWNLRDEFEDDREIYRTTNFHHYNESYDGYRHVGDMTIIEFDSPLNVTNKIYNFAALPSAPLPENVSGFGIGWGLQNFKDDNAAATKNVVTLEVVRQDDCQRAYPRMDWGMGGISDARRCVNRRLVRNCAADFGSPFIYNNEVHGIFSFGQTEACEDGNKPNGIQAVFDYLDWIRSTTGL